MIANDVNLRLIARIGQDGLRFFSQKTGKAASAAQFLSVLANAHEFGGYVPTVTLIVYDEKVIPTLFKALAQDRRPAVFIAIETANPGVKASVNDWHFRTGVKIRGLKFLKRRRKIRRRLFFLKEIVC